MLPALARPRPHRAHRSGRCSPTATWSTRRGRHRGRRVRAHLPLARRAARLPRRGPRDLPRAARSAASGFYPRLATLAPPALFVWASHDRLIPERFRRHVERWLPGAEQVVLEGCGHVPQVERPEQHQRPARALLRRVDPLDARRAGCADAPTARAPRLPDDERDGIAEQAAQRSRARDETLVRRGLPPGSAGMRAAPAAFRRPISTSATRTTSATRCRGCGCSAPVLPRRGPRPGQRPRGRARCCSSATTRAGT